MKNNEKKRVVRFEEFQRWQVVSNEDIDEEVRE
jgi:hypothetical protein